ncbi:MULTISPECIES: succinate dehydrogenase, hydrophobic membrane anchor protein [unclassified Lysobacter]
MSNSNPQVDLRNPLKRARGWGSAKSGTHHFIIQRITAVALIFLSIWAVVLLLSLIGGDYTSVRAAVADPVNAVLLASFLIASFWHAKLGMQVVIEDYVHTPWIAVTLQLTVIFICVLAALASVFAVIRITLGG